MSAALEFNDLWDGLCIYYFFLISPIFFCRYRRPTKGVDMGAFLHTIWALGRIRLELMVFGKGVLKHRLGASVLSEESVAPRFLDLLRVM